MANLANSQAPQSLERYQYRPLKSTQIRLLRLLPPRHGTKDPSDTEIKCNLFEAPLLTAPWYSALSYAWGDQQQDCDITILQNGSKVLPVTRNLFTALKRLRHPTASLILWIDQLCIDQKNVDERNQQVQLMRNIYEKAGKTIVWLGDHDEDTHLLEKMFVQLSALVGNKPNPRGIYVLDQKALWNLINLQNYSDGLSLNRREVLKRFLNRAWFRRAWVYQEAVVAADVEIVWGYLRLPFEFVAGLVLATYSLVKGEEDGKWSKEIKETKGFGPLRSIWYDRQQFHRGQPLDFLYILWRARKYLKATDPRDLVYSFLGFHNLPHQGEILPDYTVPMDDPGYARAVEDTFTTVARVMIRNASSLDIFKVIVPTRHSSYHLPSWVPNWSESRFKSGAPILTPGVPRGFNACRKLGHMWVASNPSQLHVQGHIITKITSVLEHQCSNTYFRSSLKNSLKLKELIEQVSDQMEERSVLLPSATTSVVRKRKYDNLEHSVLRTLLADGAFALKQPIEHPLPALLRIYNLNEGSILESREKGDHDLYRYLCETGNVANGKRVFLTNHLDIGLGYSTIEEGDIVCVLYGCIAPCVLRKASRMVAGCYKLIGHCYLDGWMYGENPRNWNWWKEKPETLILV
jgi:hypothetical protein